MPITILKATDDLRLNGETHADCPLILLDNVLLFIPNRWLLSVWRDSSHDTATTYARQLCVYLTFLQSRRLCWWAVTVDDVEHLDDLLKAQRHSSASRRLLLRAITAYYRFCVQRGYLDYMPFVLRSSNRRAKSETEPSIKLPRQRPRTAIYIGVGQFDAVKSCIRTQSPSLLYRTELMFECARHMGLRRQEVAGLEVSAFENILDDGRVCFITLSERTTKNSKARTVLVPPDLVYRVKRYIRIHRQFIVERAAASAPSYIASNKLFLNNSGEGVKREYISSLWNAAAKAARVDARFHSNRHWFGTVVVAAAYRRGHPDPLRAAADLLGHSDTSTTKIYAHIVAQVEADAPESVALMKMAWAFDNV